MSVKNIVKIMNFHSLLRVDKSRRKAAMYFETEKELMKIIKRIMFNRNIILDKNAITPKKDAPILNVYIGNDLGFSGDFNFLINNQLRKDEEFKVAIGKKVLTNEDDEKVILKLSKEDFYKNFHPMEELIYDAIINKKYREINVIYNHYHNVNKLEFMKKKLFPLEYQQDEDDDYGEDFALETELRPMLNNLTALYLCYEIKICEMNSYAAENVIRQQITKESKRRIEELEEEKAKIERKEKKQKEFQKIVENYRKG